MDTMFASNKLAWQVLAQGSMMLQQPVEINAPSSKFWRVDVALPKNWTATIEALSDTCVTLAAYSLQRSQLGGSLQGVSALGSTCRSLAGSVDTGSNKLAWQVLAQVSMMLQQPVEVTPPSSDF